MRRPPSDVTISSALILMRWTLLGRLARGSGRSLSSGRGRVSTGPCHAGRGRGMIGRGPGPIRSGHEGDGALMADETLLLLLDEVRGKTLAVLDGLTAEQARWA